tara:strand:- start:86 stop:289 length:204 start_codon:yes stop_codon:yes gene_type:complete
VVFKYEKVILAVKTNIKNKAESRLLILRISRLPGLAFDSIRYLLLKEKRHNPKAMPLYYQFPEKKLQ